MPLQSISRQLGEALRARGLTIATAESCTGGALAAALTAVAGSSDYFPGGVVAYSNRVKHTLLGVPWEILNGDGAVSAACASALARGARERLGVDLALATTGIAGPSGAEPGKPVGLVYLALAHARGVECRRHRFGGDRAAVIAAATQAALTLALTWLATDQVGLAGPG